MALPDKHARLSKSTMSTLQVSDADFEASMRFLNVSHGSWDYFWDWHKAFPSMTLADMHAEIDAQQAAKEAAEWRAHEAESERLDRLDEGYAAYEEAHPDIATVRQERRERIESLERAEEAARRDFETLTLSEPPVADEVYTAALTALREAEAATEAARAVARRPMTWDEQMRLVQFREEVRLAARTPEERAAEEAAEAEWADSLRGAALWHATGYPQAVMERGEAEQGEEELEMMRELYRESKEWERAE